MSYIIYKIVCDELPEYVYVGSTKNFTKRKCQHKRNCNNPNSDKHNLKIYSTIRENGGWENWRMVIINECEEGVTKTQAHIIEEEFRVKLHANMNSQKCYITKDEVQAKCNVKNAKYYQNNKELINEKARETITCICGCELTKGSLSKHLKSKKHLLLISQEL